jgi:SAM-dependent methyltransferase
MSVKGLAQRTLRTLGFEVKRIGRPHLHLHRGRAYDRRGRIPWSPGYTEARDQFIREVLDDPARLNVFRERSRLPESFGVGFDERCVEYPWLLSQLDAEPETVLDAGSTLNQVFIVDQPLFQRKKLHILTLGPEDDCFWHKGISYLYDDLRDVPIRDDYYDTIVCLSTLEHVGCDNSFYKKDESGREQRLDDFLLAMQSLRRVLKPGGSLFFSVPFGVYRHFGTFQQFDRELLSRAIAAFGKALELAQTFYRYDGNGWQTASARDCAECEYVGWVADVWQRRRWPKPLPVEDDRAAAARAVACVSLTKA